MGRQGRLLKNTLILFVGVIGTKMINFIMLPFFTKWLTVEEYGIIDVFLVGVSMIVPVCTLQIEQAVFRFMLDDKSCEYQQMVVSSGTAIVVTTLLIVDLLAIMLFIDKNDQLSWQILLAVNIQSIYVLFQQVVRGKGNNEQYTVNSIILTFSNTLLSVLFIRVMQHGVGGYISAFCISHIIAIAVYFIWSKVGSLVNWHCISISKLKLMIAYSVPMIVNNVSWWILNASDKIILNVFCGASANGIYAAAGKIPGLITTIFSVFNMAWHESTSREKDGDISAFYSEVYRKLYAVLSYMLVFLLCLCSPLFGLLIDAQFGAAYDHIPILLVAIFFYCIAQFYGGIYIGEKKSGQLGKTSMIAAVVNICFNLLLVNRIGIFAASLSTFVAYFVIWIVRFFKIRELCTITYNVKESVLSMGMVFVSFVISYMAPVVTSVVYLAIVTVVYGWLFRDVLQDIWKVVDKIKKKI